jgi:hypothetical protein
MKFKIGQTVVRQEPGGHEVSFSIQSEADVKYHTELAGKGYSYTDLTKNIDVVDFDLPTVSEVKTQPRVHVSDEICTSCEG